MANVSSPGRISPGLRNRSTPTPSGDRDVVSSPSEPPRTKLTATNLAKTAPADAFQACTDFSKMNEQLHSGQRNDTFATPTALNARYHIASGRRKGLSDTEYLIDVCEQAFQKNLRDVIKVQEEMRQSMDSIRNDLNDHLDEQNMRAKITADLLEVTTEIQQAWRRPMPVDLTPVQEELRSVMSSALQGHNMMQGLEDRLSQRLSQVFEGFESERVRQEQFHKKHAAQIKEEMQSARFKDMQDALQRSEDQLSRVLNATQSLSVDSAQAIKGVSEVYQENKRCHAQTAKDFQQIEVKNDQHHTDLFIYVERQFSKHVKDSPVNVDFSELLKQILKTQYVVEHDFDQLLGEISKIQQALNTDFARVVGGQDAAMRGSIAFASLANHDHLKERIAAKYLAATSPAILTSDPAIKDNSSEEPINSNDCTPRSRRLSAHDENEGSMSTNVQDLQVRPMTSESMRRNPTRKNTHIIGKRERMRVRDFWTQTEGDYTSAGETAEKEVQTEGDMMTHKMSRAASRKKLKKSRTPKSMQVVPAPPKVKNSVGPSNVFGDAQVMKQKVRANLIQPQYDVTDMYHKRGCFQAIAKSSLFENINFSMILLNAVWIAVDTDHNDKAILTEAHPVFQVVENFFCVYFTCELLIRFLAFKRKLSCFYDKWFVFDSCLVFLMVAETWVLTAIVLALGWSSNQTDMLRESSILRVARLAKVIRMTRMAKLLRAIPELVVLVRGLVIAFRTVMVFVILWGVLVFVFGVLFRQLTDGQDIGYQYFRSVPAAMNTLLLNGLIPEIEVFVRELGDNPLLWILIMTFVILASLTVMHMLVAVLVELISAISVAEREGMTVTYVSSELRAAMVVLNMDLKDNLNKLQFQELLSEPAISGVIQAAGVDVVSLLDMSDVIFEDLEDGEGGLSFENLVEIVLNMRGSNTATVKDVKAQLKIMKTIVKDAFRAMLEDVGGEFQFVKTQLAAIADCQRRAFESQNDSEDSVGVDSTYTSFAAITPQVHEVPELIGDPDLT